MSMELLTSSNYCCRISGGSYFNSHPTIPPPASSNSSSAAHHDGITSFGCSSSTIRFRTTVKAFARRSSGRKLTRRKEEHKNVTMDTQDDGSSSLNDFTGQESSSGSVVDDSASDDSSPVVTRKDVKDLVGVPSRSSVLQACIGTSGLIAGLGFVIRQASHATSSGGLPILDCSALVSFNFETWHLELISGLVILISSSRYLLLKTWPDFAESSESANRQILTSLETLDYVIVAFLPGITEELLFRGALLPLFGLDWKSALAVGALFGVLHLGSGRKYSFALWATFVGFAYGYAAIISSSVVVPMASHSLNNLIGALLWRHSSKSSITQ